MNRVMNHDSCRRVRDIVFNTVESWNNAPWPKCLGHKVSWSMASSSKFVLSESSRRLSRFSSKKILRVDFCIPGGWSCIWQARAPCLNFWFGCRYPTLNPTSCLMFNVCFTCERWIKKRLWRSWQVAVKCNPYIEVFVYFSFLTTGPWW